MREFKDATIALNVRLKLSGFSAYPCGDGCQRAGATAAEESADVNRRTPGEAWETKRRSVREKRVRMHGRVHDLSMIALRQQRLVIIFLMVLAGGLLCSELTADAKSDYDIINTGVNGGGCWYDESHFIVVKGQQPAPGQEFEVEGLYYLDPNYPKDLKRIDLSPLEPSLQRHIRDVTCQGQTVLFHILTADKKRNTVYSINIGQSPRVVVAKQEGFILPQSVNVRERYVLGVTNAISEPHSPNAEQAVKDCNFSNLMDGYRVFCLRHDRGTKRTWPVNNGFVAQYIWEETIRVNKNGQYQWVPNQEPPLKLPDGTALKQGYLLRNLENQVLAKVKMEQPPYAIYRNTFIVNPQGNALYAACSKVGDHGTRRLTVGGRVCRFPMDGVIYQWTEAAAMQQSPQDPISLQQLNTNERGDIVATELAHRGVTSIWKYTAATLQVGKVYQASSLTDLGGPQLSPTGQWISFSERQILYLARAKGVQP